MQVKPLKETDQKRDISSYPNMLILLMLINTMPNTPYTFVTMSSPRKSCRTHGKRTPEHSYDVWKSQDQLAPSEVAEHPWP